MRLWPRVQQYLGSIVNFTRARVRFFSCLSTPFTALHSFNFLMPPPDPSTHTYLLPPSTAFHRLPPPSITLNILSLFYTKPWGMVTVHDSPTHDSPEGRETCLWIGGAGPQCSTPVYTLVIIPLT